MGGKRTLGRELICEALFGRTDASKPLDENGFTSVPKVAFAMRVEAYAANQRHAEPSAWWLRLSPSNRLSGSNVQYVAQVSNAIDRCTITILKQFSCGVQALLEPAGLKVRKPSAGKRALRPEGFALEDEVLLSSGTGRHQSKDCE